MTDMVAAQSSATWINPIPNRSNQFNRRLSDHGSWAWTSTERVGTALSISSLMRTGVVESSTSCFEYSSSKKFSYLMSAEIAPSILYSLALPGNASDLMLLERVVRNLRQYFAAALITVLPDSLQECKYSINIVGQSEDDLDQLEGFYLNWWFQQAESLSSTIKFVLR